MSMILKQQIGDKPALVVLIKKIDRWLRQCRTILGSGKASVQKIDRIIAVGTSWENRCAIVLSVWPPLAAHDSSVEIILSISIIVLDVWSALDSIPTTVKLTQSQKTSLLKSSSVPLRVSAIMMLLGVMREVKPVPRKSTAIQKVIVIAEALNLLPSNMKSLLNIRCQTVKSVSDFTRIIPTTHPRV